MDGNVMITVLLTIGGFVFWVYTPVLRTAIDSCARKLGMKLFSRFPYTVIHRDKLNELKSSISILRDERDSLSLTLKANMKASRDALGQSFEKPLTIGNANVATKDANK